MYIQYRRNSCKLNGCSPLQNRNGLISLKPAIGYFLYTKRWVQYFETSTYERKPAIRRIFPSDSCKAGFTRRKQIAHKTL